MRVKSEFQIYGKTHRSGKPGWIVSLGTINGKRKFRSFQTLEAAQHFKAQCMEKNALKIPPALADMSELGRASVRLALEKLKPYEASVSEAVDFYVKHAKPAKGKITIQEAMDLFQTAKENQNCSAKYVKHSRRCFFMPFKSAFKNCYMNEVTSTAAYKYIYKNSRWNITSKNSHNRHLRAFYSFVISRGHATLNPFGQVPFAKERKSSVGEKIISPENIEKLLQYALDNGYSAECASMALVFFCGVRVDEVSRIRWEKINLRDEKPFVDVSESKNSRRRVNTISSNAMHWLVACRSRGIVAPENYEKRMQRLRKASGVQYPQNAARHSFSSYHLAYHEDASKTAFMLGHPNPALLYSTYRELVNFEEADKYWDIVPEFVRVERRKLEQEARAREKAALLEADRLQREEAEMQSNCGRAEKGEDGRWVSVVDENANALSFEELVGPAIV